MLNITDPSLLEITKIKPWAIYFNYDNEKYLLHGSTDGYESEVCLYKRNWNGRYYDLEELSGYLAASDNVENHFIKYKCKSKVYSQIDKNKFIALLDYNDLCKTCLAMQVGKNKSIMEKNRKKVNKLYEEIHQLQKRNQELAKFE